MGATSIPSTLKAVTLHGLKVSMSVAVEKSGFKLKIPPDDYVKSERSKPGSSFKKPDKKKFREPKPNLQKRISQRSKHNADVVKKAPVSLHAIRELSAKEKNRRRIEELR